MKKDAYCVSEGNVAVLACVPHMMKIPKYRKQLRLLALDYIVNGTCKK